MYSAGGGMPVWTGKTKPGSDCVRLTKPGQDPKKKIGLP